MRGGTYYADDLLPGDKVHGAVVLDCTGIGDGKVQVTLRRPDRTTVKVNLPRNMPVTAS